MPALNVLNRRWYIATDDFPGPSVVGSVFYIAWTVILAVAIGTLSNYGDCPASKRFLAYYSMLLIVDFFLAVLLTALTLLGLRGSILDTHKRWLVPWLVEPLGFFTILLVGVNGYGSHILWHEARECYGFTTHWSPYWFGLNVVINHWSSAGVFFGIALITFNLFPDHSDLKTWERRCTCVGYVLCCLCFEPKGPAKIATDPKTYKNLQNGDVEMGPVTANNAAAREGPAELDGNSPRSQRTSMQGTLDEFVQAERLSPLVRLAAVFEYMYGSVDLTFSDLATAIMLVGIQGSLKREAAFKAAMAAKNFGNGAADPALPGTADQTVQHQRLTPSGHTLVTVTNTTTVQQIPDAVEKGSTSLSNAHGTHAPPLSSMAHLEQLHGGANTATFDAARVVFVADANGRPPAGGFSVDEANGMDGAANSYPEVVPANGLGGAKQGAPHSDTTVIADCTAAGHDVAAAGSMSRWAGAQPAIGTPNGHGCSTATAGTGATASSANGTFPHGQQPNNHDVGGGGESGGQLCVPDEPLDAAMLENVLYYFKLACAAYGWPMYLWMHRSTTLKCCSVCCGCCSCCRDVRRDPSIYGSKLSISQSMHVEAIHLLTGLSPDTDLLYLSSNNMLEGALPYFIALNRARKEVVLSIRGSMSMRDTLTDLMCEPTLLGADWLRGPGHANEGPALMEASSPSERAAAGNAPSQGLFYAHTGIFSCAQAISLDLEARGVLRAVLLNDVAAQQNLRSPQYAQDCRGWTLVVIGHSLGAGVAALLSLQLRNMYPTVQCWAFSPPGGLLSPACSHELASFCTSVVVGRDMIPRISLRAVEKLNEDMLMAAARCKVPKAVLWLHTLLPWRKRWTEEELFKPEDQVDQEVLKLVQSYKEGLARHASRRLYENGQDFMAPGKILYLEWVKRQVVQQQYQVGGQYQAPRADEGEIAESKVFEKAFVPRWIAAEELRDQGLFISKRMFSMHVPDFQLKAIEQCLQEVRAHMPQGPGPRPPSYSMLTTAGAASTL